MLGFLSAPRINTNQPPTVCAFLLPLSFLVVLFRSRNRVLETIEIALPTPQIVQRRRLSELPVLFPARRVVQFPDRAALPFLVAGEQAAAAVLGSGVV